MFIAVSVALWIICYGGWTFCFNPSLSIPKELAVYKRFEEPAGKNVVEVTVEKTVDLDQKDRPCYDPAENNNVSFGEHDYQILAQKIREKFNCTTLFIPEKFRSGAEICKNETGLYEVHQFLQYSSSSHATNLWTADYYTIPPCVYHKYTVHDTIRARGNHYH